MIHCVAGACPVKPTDVGYLLVVETQEVEPGMRYNDSVFVQLLKPISRRGFGALVDRHDGDAYDKSFTSWDHLVCLIFAQLSGVDSLRNLETVWGAHAHHHYHLGSGPAPRATLSDANARRPAALFADTFQMISSLADRRLKREGGQILRLIDSTPIPLDAAIGWADWNGRTKGLKLHVVYDPSRDHPRRIAITPSTVNDILVGEDVEIEPNATYVFDKGYCNYAWWTRIAKADSLFVTRPKTNATYKVIRWRKPVAAEGDGFIVLADAEVKLASQGKAKLNMPLRRIRIKRKKGGVLTIVTNDLERSAVEIAALYKARWQIELLFRWLKQHLKLKRFLARSENGVRLQIIAAMIAYLLLRIAARQSRLAIAAIRFAELVAQCLFVRKPILKIDKPPDVHPTKPKPIPNNGQLEFAYA
jgi:putative transposase